MRQDEQVAAWWEEAGRVREALDTAALAMDHHDYEQARRQVALALGACWEIHRLLLVLLGRKPDPVLPLSEKRERLQEESARGTEDLLTEK